jgi:hypothetical protein
VDGTCMRVADSDSSFAVFLPYEESRA